VADLGAHPGGTSRAETRAQTASRRKEQPHTPRLTRALELATKCAIKRGQDYTGTEHLLIGRAGRGRELRRRRAEEPGVDLSKPRAMFEAQVPASGNKVREAPLTERSRERPADCARAGDRHGSRLRRCETMLLGLLLEPEGMGGQILRSLGVTYDAARAEILKLVHGRA
jgi:ATP-dependent Clp protease ATP-binding subunit ClpA